MSFGFTKTIFVLAGAFLLLGLLKSPDNGMWLTRAAAPVLAYLFFMVPVVIVLDLRQWWKWKKLARQEAAKGPHQQDQRPQSSENETAPLLTPQNRDQVS